MPHRGAAMAEFWRALKTPKALQAEQAADGDSDSALAHPIPQGRRAHLPQPNEPEGSAASSLDDLPGAPPRSRRGHRSRNVPSRTNPSAAPYPDRTICQAPLAPY